MNKFHRVLNVNYSFPKSADGFALIVTISLMLLMSLVVIGLLSLATSAVRTTAIGDTRASAEANARMALMIAIGDLQKALGPDQRISAPASMVKTNPPHPNMIGAWKSWVLDPNNPSYAEKKNRFQRWLVSTGGDDDPKNVELPTGALSDVITLIKPVNLSAFDPSLDPKGPQLDAGLVSVQSPNGKHGAYAYAVMDESLKASLNLPAPGNLDIARGLAQRAVPYRSHPEIIVPQLAPEIVGDPTRLISLPTAGLAAGVPAQEILGRGQALTSQSLSLLTDTAKGGLKKDLTTAFESNMDLAGPDAFGAETVYHTAKDGAPRWDYLRSHYQQYRRVSQTASGEPSITLSAQELTPETKAEGAGFEVSPTSERLLPVIAKLQLVFSMVTHHNHLGDRINFYNSEAGTLKNKDFAVPHLAYDPVITLYNPYDVALELPHLRVRIWDPPVLFGFKKNGQWLRPDHANGIFHGLARFQINNQYNVNARKSFTLSLTDKKSTDSAGAPIKMLPGEVRVFSPMVEEQWTWGFETRGGMVPWVFFDWNADSDFANRDPRNGGNPFGIFSVPGWDVRAGMQTDHLAHNGQRGTTLYDFEQNKTNDGFVNVKLSDTTGVHAIPGRTVNNNTSPDFEVDILAGKNVDVERDYLRSYVFRYADVAAQLKGMIPSDGINREFKVGDLLQAPNDRSVGGKSPFAMLTMAAKTTAEADDFSMPWLHNHPVTEGTNQNTQQVGDALNTYDLKLEELFGDFTSIAIDPMTNRGYFGGGVTAATGVSNVPMFRVPLIPAASLGDLISANMIASGALPRVTRAFGNSRAHPLIPANAVRRVSPVAGAGLMLDHSYLLNAALWDSTFFSTVASFSGELVSNTARATILEKFLAGEQTLLNSRYVPMLANGQSASETANKLDSLSDEQFMNDIAAHMAVRGGFNINSDSIPAWKAMISSLRDEAVRGWKNQEFNKDKGKTSFPRTSLPLAGDAEGSEAASIDVQGAVRWAGFRALTDAQIATLAEKIVQESRARAKKDGAPFLSLGEFVNRRVGGSGEIQSMAGVLATAIDESGINDGAPYDLDSKIITGSEILPPGALQGLAEPEARLGKTAQGAPSFVTQGDLLTPLSAVITPRGDTFRIRAYGEARDSNNKVLRVWCEAVVQRIPEYLDASDNADKGPSVLKPVNQTFGRRFVLTSFRWLSPHEI